MILTADSEIARQTARRRTGTGWNTRFIGANRYTLQPGEAPPASDVIYPMAFLVEKEPGAITKPHFHQADQYQVVVHGGGKLGLHDTAGIAVHYTDAYSAYGPIVAGDQGIWWFTLRNGWDPGAKYMPASRLELREARSRYTHWEATTEPAPPGTPAALTGIAAVESRIELEGEHGLATWRYRVPAGGSLTGPEPIAGGGQFWLVVAGTFSVPGSAPLPPNSLVFVYPDDAALSLTAGPNGAEALCMQFRVPLEQRVAH